MDNYPIPPELMGLAAPPPMMGNPAGLLPSGGTAEGEVAQLSPANQMAMTGSPDPILAALLSMPGVTPEPPKIKKRFAKMAKPDESMVRLVVFDDESLHQELLSRFARDLQIYRQHQSSTPPGHNDQTDLRFIDPTPSNVINKLANMCSTVDIVVEAPFKDEQTKEASQAIEDLAYYCRDYERDQYAVGGGAHLQWDEFWFLFLYGRLVTMVLPDESDPEYPWISELLDPSTCFPTFGNSKEGLIRMTRSYVSTVAEVIATWGKNDSTVQKKLADKLGYDRDNINEWLNWEVNVKEYWDKDYHAVVVDDVFIVPVVEHGLGCIPFVYVTAKGEPKAVYTPRGQYNFGVDQYNNSGFSVGRQMDIAEKGISVFHHLVNTHRLTEIMNTMLMMEALKAQNPATITYTAPSMIGTDPPPLDNKPGGNNLRVLNMQKVEGIPTSPRPTDVAPVMNQLQQNMTQGTIPPHVFGAEQGSNVSGFAVESLIAAAKDAILPYVSAWETHEQLKLALKLKFYRDIISPTMLLSVPTQGSYGMSYVRAVTPEMIDAVGTKVKVRLFGIAQQNLPGQIQAATQAMQGGIWSQRKAMEHVGVRNPDRMLADIISERAIQHPAIMETFIIPQGFINRGDEDLARLWLQLVVAPKMGELTAMMGGPGAEGPQPNGQSAPLAGEAPPPPGGPQPGEGRGPI